MITVVEIWHFKPEFQDKVLELMQSMDNVVGPPAHKHPGWCGHAKFYQNIVGLSDVMMLYPWRSQELHQDLANQEEPLLQDFHDKYCAAPREIYYYTELPVEVEHNEFDTEVSN